MQAMFLQFVVPFTLFFSVVYLRLSFLPGHYIGALTIIVGLVLNLLPSLISSGVGTKPSVFWCLVFIFAQVPQAFGAVYQEKAFSKAKVNVAYMMAWASLGQALFVIACAPLNFVPKFGSLSPSDFQHHLGQGLQCIVAQLPHHPECEHAALWLLLCVAAMLGANVFQALVVKFGSAALCVVVQTLVTPVSALSFAVPWFMGDHTEKLSWITLVALAILMTGIALYRAADMRRMGQRDLATRMSMRSRSQSLEGSVKSSPRKGLGQIGSLEIVRMDQGGDSDADSEPLLASSVPGSARTVPHLPTSQHEPILISSGIGIIASEYTNDGADDVNILFENTILTRSRQAASSI